MISAYVWLLCVLPLTISWVALAVRRRLPTGGAKDRRDPGDKRPPPGPRPLPLVGNLLQLDDQPHRSLSGLARVHGPLMSLRLGRVPVVVVSSPSVAKQVLRTHDHALSARAAPDSISAHNELSMAWLPPAAQWRRLRRLCNTHLFNPQILDDSRGLRLKKVRELVSFVGECSRAGKAVDVGCAAATATLNLISNTLFSSDVGGHGAESSAEFKGLVRNIMEEAGGPNVADYFPLLRWADPQGRRRRFSHSVGRLRQLFGGIIDGRLQSRCGGAGTDAEDFLDALLDSHATSQLDRPTILSLLVFQV
uniref:Cytochrome P450 76C4 n=1 Tax=Anthurium amnicola TaxID=1678845 RepID=A0A1D1ZGM0_9ARAE